MSNINFNLESTVGKFKLKAVSEFSQGVNFIWGRSGNGKTTLLNNLAGFINPNVGEIKINNLCIFSSKKKIDLPPEKRKISYVQQDEKLFPNMKVLENIEFAYKFLNNTQKKISPSDCIDLFDIKNLIDFYPTQLSGGQKQKVALARALARNGNVLMLDEPINSIDFTSSRKIFKTIEDLSKTLNLCVLYITHSIDEIFRTNNQILFVNNGLATEKQTKNNILNFWDDENLINFTDDKKYSEKYFSSESIMISKKNFDHQDLGFYFSGIINNIVKTKEKSLLEIKSEKDYLVSLDNAIFNKLQLKNKDKVFCFVYKNLIL
jgi:ABC-type molybdate transport system ATPase subunit